MYVRGDEMTSTKDKIKVLNSLIDMEEFINTLDSYRNENIKAIYNGSIIVVHIKNETIEFINLSQDINWDELLSSLLSFGIENKILCCMIEEITGEYNQIFYTSNGEIFNIRENNKWTRKRLCTIKDAKVIEFPTGDNNE